MDYAFNFMIFMYTSMKKVVFFCGRCMSVFVRCTDGRKSLMLIDIQEAEKDNGSSQWWDECNSSEEFHHVIKCSLTVVICSSQMMYHLSLVTGK